MKRFLTILIFDTPSGAETSLSQKKSIFWPKCFKRVCFCVHILFSGVRNPKRVGKVYSGSQKTFDHSLTLQS